MDPVFLLNVEHKCRTCHGLKAQPICNHSLIGWKIAQKYSPKKKISKKKIPNCSSFPFLIVNYKCSTYPGFTTRAMCIGFVQYI